MHTASPDFALHHARIWGIGVDLCQIDRVAAAHTRHPLRFAQRILTPEEYALFMARSRQDSSRGLQFLASRFAAKEALAKALGTGIRGVMGFQAASILPDELGKPCVHTHGEMTKLFAANGWMAHISLSDDAGWVVAYCVIEKRA